MVLPFASSSKKQREEPKNSWEVFRPPNRFWAEEKKLRSFRAEKIRERDIERDLGKKPKKRVLYFSFPRKNALLFSRGALILFFIKRKLKEKPLNYFYGGAKKKERYSEMSGEDRKGKHLFFPEKVKHCFSF